MRCRGLWIVGFVAVVVGSSIVAPPLGSAASASDSVQVVAAEVLASPPRPVDLLGVACSAATRCILATDPAAVTEDGGTTWRTLPRPRFNAVACASSTSCLAIDALRRAVTSGDGGATWGVAGSLNGFNARAIS